MHALSSTHARGSRQRRRVLRSLLVLKSALATALVAVVSGCDGVASVLDPAGPRAQAVADLTWLMTAIAAAVFVLVGALLAWAIWRGRGTRAEDAPPSRLGRRGLVIAGGIALPAVVLPIVYVLSLVAMSGLTRPGTDTALELDVTASMWRYETAYPDGTVLVDEIRIPVGEPVLLRLHSTDVIHSFWVPRLAGKQDFVPGRVNQIWIEASQAGQFVGRCAEFCGVGHARMELVVIAQEASAFAAWLAGSR